MSPVAAALRVYRTRCVEAQRRECSDAITAATVRAGQRATGGRRCGDRVGGRGHDVTKRVLDADSNRGSNEAAAVTLVGWTVNTSLFAVPAVTLKDVLVALVRPVALAVSV